MVEAEDDERHGTTVRLTRRIVREGPGQYKPRSAKRAGSVRYSSGMRYMLPLAIAAGLALASPAAGAASCVPADPRQQLETADLALARGAWPAAARALACAAAASGEPAVAERATRVGFELAQWRPALDSARRWVALQPDREEARRHLALLLLRLHRSDESAAQFALILDTAYTDRAQGYEALLDILRGEANDAGAARVMQRLAGRDPGLPEAQHALSVLWQRAEHGSRALESAERALELRPGWDMALLARARALLLLGRKAEGLEAAREAAEDGGELARLNLAWMLAGAGEDDAAIAEFEALRRQRGGAAPALEGLGAVAWDRGEYEAASRLFTELAQASRGADTAVAYLGLIADRQGDKALAARYLSRVTSGPRALPSQLQARRLLVELGAPETAELLLDDYLAASPEQTRDLVVRLANQEAADGDGAAAVALLERLVATYPDDDDLRLAQGFVFERLDRVGEAVAVMRDVLKRRPDDPTALNSLGYTLVDRTTQVREGHDLIARAIEARPDSYAIVDSMGWALFRLGRPAEARVWLQRAWDRSQDPEVAAHLGEVLWSLGERDAARRLWSEAAERAPDNRTLQRTLERHPG
jgi:Flp pilus assembly protein TadD